MTRVVLLAVALLVAVLGAPPANAQTRSGSGCGTCGAEIYGSREMEASDHHPGCPFRGGVDSGWYFAPGPSDEELEARRRNRLHAQLAETQAMVMRLAQEWAAEVAATSAAFDGSVAERRLEEQLARAPLPPPPRPDVLRDVRALSRGVRPGVASSAAPLVTDERWLRALAPRVEVAPPVDWAAGTSPLLRDGRMVVVHEGRAPIVVPPPPPVRPGADDVGPTPFRRGEALDTVLVGAKEGLVGAAQEWVRTTAEQALSPPLRRIVRAQRAALGTLDDLPQLVPAFVEAVGSPDPRAMLRVQQRWEHLGDERVKRIDRELGAGYRYLLQPAHETAGELAPSRLSWFARRAAQLHELRDRPAERARLLEATARDLPAQVLGSAR